MPKNFPKITASAALFFLCLGFSGLSLAEIDQASWNEKKSTHFIVYSQEASAEYIDEVIRQAEIYYHSITEELGFTRFSSFWTWENRTKIYICDNLAEYRKRTNQPAWAASEVNVIKKEMLTFVDRDEFFDMILPHELGHIIFREFVGCRRKLPLWLDEGIASFLEKKNRNDRLMLAKLSVKMPSFISFDQLQQTQRVNMLMPQVFYAESASIINFLLDEYGREKFFDFCHALQKSRPDQEWTEAFFGVYKFKDFTDMESKWIAYLLKTPFTKPAELFNKEP
ncbi:MAG: peptidase MA family metallohydrolase [Candidatus Omnitrophica bacterium]|nr:peptidase MA family metallohydrolase [Candidatus Omnitrophota bacterium]